MALLNLLAWLAAAGGGAMACTLLTLDCLGKAAPAFIPFETRRWSRFVLIFLAGTIWLLFTGM